MFFPLDLMGVDQRPENHLVSMFWSHRITLLGALSSSLTDMFLVIYLARSCANSPLFVALVGNACSNYLYLSWLEDSILLLEISLPIGDVCSRGRWVGANLPRSMSFSLLSIH